MLEQLARDVTGWPARVGEMFQLLGWTQHMNHIRPESCYAPDLRRWEKLERLNTPFDSLSHTVDVRGIAKGQGKYNIPNIGVFLWRLRAYRLHGAPALPAAPGDTQRFLFDSLGMERQLFTRDEAELEISHLAEPINAPVPLSRRVLANFLDRYYGEDKSLAIAGAALATIQICNLSDSAGGWAHTPPPAGKIAIDPVLGRIACGDVQAQPPQVMFHYGFSADMGAGEYDRAATLTETPTAGASVPVANPTVQAALALVQPAGGVVEITDSGRYVETPAINAASATKVELRAANERRPTLVLGGVLEIAGGDQAEVTINGLLIAGGSLRIADTPGNQLRRLRLRHCTLVPDGQPTLIVEIPNVTVEIDHCIVGPLRIAAGSTVQIANSIVDAKGETNVAYCGTASVPAGQPEAAGGTVEILNSTIVGKVRSVEFKLVANAIFVAALDTADLWTSPVRSEKKQQGCVRFSYLPPGSLTPRRYRCQPDFEIATRIDAAEKAAGGAIGSVQVNAIRAEFRVGWCRASRPCAMAWRATANCGSLVRRRFAPAPTMKRRWARSTICFSPSARPICACAWTSICASAWRREFFTTAKSG